MALSFAFDASRGETPDLLARRRENADVLAARMFGQAPKNVGEGLSMLGQALILRQMQDENSAAIAAGQATVPAFLRGGSDAMPSTSMAPAPMGNLPAMPQAGIVQNDGNAAPGTVGMNQRLADLAYDFIDDNPGTSLSSGHRSTERQAQLYADRANNPNPVAPPGTSKHERGMAVDIGGMNSATRAMLPQYGLAQPVPNDPPHVELARPTQLASNDPAAVPVNASEAQGYAIPGQTGQRGGSLFPSASTADLAKALTNPWAKQYHSAIETELKMRADADKVSTIDLGNEVGIMRGGQIIRREPKGEPNKAPSFGVIGEDEFGNKRYGWTDSRNRSVTEYEAGGTKPPSTLPPVPDGVDPKKWREIHSERVTNDSLPADDKATSGLRNEIQGLPSYKNLSQAAPVYRAMAQAASLDDRAADLNLIYGFGKIMDPGSVVRESEMSMAEKINTLPQYMRATVESQLSGSGRLSPEVRAQILQQANIRIQAYKGLYDQDMGMYRGIAKDRRMKESHVIPDFGSFEPWQPKASSPVNSNQPIVIDGYTIKAR